MWEKVIVYSRMDDYYAQVEEILFPKLKEVAFVVGEKDGIVLSRNDLAKDLNIHVGESVKSALAKCPHLYRVTPHYKDYEVYSERVKNIYREYSDKVESFKEFENWIDLTMSQGIYGGHPVDIAKEMQERIYNELGLRVAFGVSFNKLFAKLASFDNQSDFAVIMRRYYKKEAYPLQLQETPYLTYQDIEILNQNGIYTVGGVAYRGSETLKDILGQKGIDLWNLVHGENVDEDQFSIFECDVQMIARDVVDSYQISTYEQATALLYEHVISLVKHMDDYGLKGKSISIRMRDQYFHEYTFEKKVSIPTREMHTIMNVVDMLVRDCCLNGWNGQFIHQYQSMSLIIGELSYDDENVYQFFDSYENHFLFSMEGFKQKFGFGKMKRSLG